MFATESESVKQRATAGSTQNLDMTHKHKTFHCENEQIATLRDDYIASQPPCSRHPSKRKKKLSRQAFER